MIYAAWLRPKALCHFFAQMCIMSGKGQDVHNHDDTGTGPALELFTLAWVAHGYERGDGIYKYLNYKIFSIFNVSGQRAVHGNECFGAFTIN